MQITGENTVPASREAVFDSMLDPESLKSSLPGCESLEEIGEHEYAAVMTIGVAMIKCKYQGKVKIKDIDRPNSFTMAVEGKGPQGQVSGEGHLTFVEEGPTSTTVKYDGDATVRGVLARIGGRVIQPAAKMIVGKFFDSLSSKVAQN